MTISFDKAPTSRRSRRCCPARSRW